jgi:glycosyltransferase involved in cell wall biosynthesis
MAPRLSVVIPVKNCLPYLPTAVDSIRKQRLDAVEIVVIGDQSTGALDRWLAQESKRDARLKWLLGRARVFRRRAMLTSPRATRQARETERFKALGAAGVVVKPFDPMTLAATARGFLKTP